VFSFTCNSFLNRSSTTGYVGGQLVITNGWRHAPCA